MTEESMRAAMAEGAAERGEDSVPRKKSIMERAEDLRHEALEEVKAAARDDQTAERAKAAARAKLREAVAAAVSLGIDREEAGKAAGVSASTAGQWSVGKKDEGGEGGGE